VPWLAADRRSQAARGGFTLLELLIVSALAAALAGFSWPAIRRSFARAERQQAVREVADSLAEARLRALVRGRPQLWRYNDLTREIELFECEFDEATPSDFAGDDGPRGAVGSTPPPAGPDANDLASGARAARNASPSVQAAAAEAPGPPLAWVESRLLPTGYRLATSHESLGELPLGGTFAQASAPLTTVDPAPTDATVGAPADSTAIRFAFDVHGATGDGQLALVGPDGAVTPLTIDGARGAATAGPVQRPAADVAAADGVTDEPAPAATAAGDPLGGAFP
jgi:prepilin-type N-terminal cleavage/methylation domain-containing protein